MSELDVGRQEQLEIGEVRPVRHALAVKCPSCSAPAGVHCITPNGEYAEGTHKARHRLASYSPTTAK